MCHRSYFGPSASCLSRHLKRDNANTSIVDIWLCNMLSNYPKNKYLRLKYLRQYHNAYKSPPTLKKSILIILFRWCSEIGGIGSHIQPTKPLFRTWKWVAVLGAAVLGGGSIGRGGIGDDDCVGPNQHTPRQLQNNQLYFN